MTNKLWEDIQTQGDNLLHVVDYLYGPERDRLESAAQAIQNDRPVVLIGIASAAYTCMPAAIYLGQHGINTNLLYASDALYYLLPALRKANVVINSRSGETAEIVKLAQALWSESIPFTAITNEPGSTLAKLATHVIWANSRKDDLVSINIVSGMMATTLAFAAAITGESNGMRLDLLSLTDTMRQTIHNASILAEAMASLFRSTCPLYFLYRGSARGAAYCSRLVLEEVARIPAVALDAAEFRQGPNEVIDKNFGAVIFVPGGVPGKLNRSLGRDILQLGGKVLFIGERGEIKAKQSVHFPIHLVPDHLRPIVDIVPVQVLAYKLAEAQGITPGEVRYITKVITSEEGHLSPHPS